MIINNPEDINCNCEIKLLKLKANYNRQTSLYFFASIVIAR